MSNKTTKEDTPFSTYFKTQRTDYTWLLFISFQDDPSSKTGKAGRRPDASERPAELAHRFCSFLGTMNERENPFLAFLISYLYVRYN